MKTIIIAEIGENHYGQWDICRALVEEAIANGPTFIKFQTYTADQFGIKCYPPDVARHIGVGRSAGPFIFLFFILFPAPLFGARLEGRESDREGRRSEKKRFRGRGARPQVPSAGRRAPRFLKKIKNGALGRLRRDGWASLSPRRGLASGWLVTPLLERAERATVAITI